MSSAKNIMIQGTSSSAGKSLFTAGLCRIFMKRGFKAAPFKSQNMTRNAFIIDGGKKIAGSQLVQAEAAGIEPETDMNPILLMPNSDTGSMLVIDGEDREDLQAKKYHDVKKSLIPYVENAYRRLEKDRDIIVMEGAGSPAEINLRKDDFVNMGLAHMTDAPVILIADIERGGVFASIYGTVKILDEEDSRRIKGFIINKFRGDVTILEPGIDELEERLKIPCLGVLPYEKFNIEEEDSLFDGKRGERIEEIEHREAEYDRLAEFIEKHTDIDKLMEIAGVKE